MYSSNQPFDFVRAEQNELLTGKYYCELPGTFICGKTYGIVEFDKEYGVSVEVYYECKGIYFTLFKENVSFGKTNDLIFYRGNNFDIFTHDKKLALLIISPPKVELLEMKRDSKSDSLYTFIKQNALNRKHLE